MMGFPATCRIAMPAPSSTIETRKSANEAAPREATSMPASAAVRPEIKTIFFPHRF
jgi:hypothetical protein